MAMPAANSFSFKVLSRWQTEMDQSIRSDQSARWLGLLPDQLEPGPVAVEVAVGVEVGVAGHHVFVGPVQPSVIVLVAELQSCAGGWIAEGLDPPDDLVLAEGGAVRARHGIRRDAVDGVGDVALELGDYGCLLRQLRLFLAIQRGNDAVAPIAPLDRKSTRLNSRH